MVVFDMNESVSRAQGSRCYKLLKVVVNKNDFESWAQGSRCYGQRRFVVYMKTPGHELRALDALDNSMLLLT